MIRPNISSAFKSSSLLVLLALLGCGVSATSPAYGADTVKAPTGDIPTLATGRKSNAARLQQSNLALLDYLEMVRMNSLESASQYWSPRSSQRASRLGISYQGMPIKADMNSPLFKSAAFKPDLQLKGGGALQDLFCRLGVQARYRDDLTTYQYYSVEIDGYPWLVFPQDYFARDWEIRQTRFFRIYIAPGRESYVNDIALQSLDNFVETTAQILGLSGDDLELLGREKIDYYFCADEKGVEQITGVEVRGLYDLASDAVITSALPHYHEVAHLLVNFRLRSLPITTLPFLREGLATSLGGRAGRSSSAILDMASFLFRSDFLSVDSVLELAAFHGDLDASISYSGAALLVRSLVDIYGMEPVLKVYRSLSGDYARISGFSARHIQKELENNLGVSWSEISASFAGKYVSGDFRRQPGAGSLLAGGFPSEAGSPVADTVEIVVDERRVYVRGSVLKPAGENWTIFFGAGEKLSSVLLEEQFGDQAASLRGYRYGIRLDVNEAGLYDYATSTLLAKFIASFEPGAPYLSPDSQTVSFNFSRDLCGGLSPLGDSHIVR